jgi:hypothetical protein
LIFFDTSFSFSWHLRCDAPFIFLFFTQHQRRSLPRTLSEAKWKGRTLHLPVPYSAIASLQFIIRSGARNLLSFIYTYIAQRIGTIFANSNFMKITHLFLVLVFVLGACSSSKKTTSTKTISSNKITEADRFRGGVSIENAIVIRVEKEQAGVEEEYKWLAINYPGYSMIRKTQTSRAAKHYDLVKIRTKDGQQKDIYFDITSFFGKR